jgi:hypothetical protein
MSLLARSMPRGVATKSITLLEVHMRIEGLGFYVSILMGPCLSGACLVACQELASWTVRSLPRGLSGACLVK